MSLKNKMYLLLVLASVFSAAAFTLLVVAYLNGFQVWNTLTLLLAVVLTVFGWGYYYVTRVSYKDSLQPKKKYSNKGNRKNRRKGL